MHPRQRLIRPRGFSRRDFLRLSGGVAGGVLLSACGGAAPTSQGGASEGASASGGGDAAGLAIGSPGNPVEQPLFDDIPPIESGLEIEEGGPGSGRDGGRARSGSRRSTSRYR